MIISKVNDESNSAVSNHRTLDLLHVKIELSLITGTTSLRAVKITSPVNQLYKLCHGDILQLLD